MKGLSKLPTLQSLQQAIRKDELARFLPWARPDYRWDWLHTQYIVQHLQLVADGEIENLMISVPPQHGKTETASVWEVAWWLYREPGIRLALATYNQEHANKISLAARRLTESIGLQIADDKSAVQEWCVEGGGRLRAVGFGGGLSGYAVDIGIIDDPY